MGLLDVVCLAVPVATVVLGWWHIRGSSGDAVVESWSGALLLVMSCVLQLSGYLIPLVVSRPAQTAVNRKLNVTSRAALPSRAGGACAGGRARSSSRTHDLLASASRSSDDLGDVLAAKKEAIEKRKAREKALKEKTERMVAAEKEKLAKKKEARKEAREKERVAKKEARKKARTEQQAPRRNPASAMQSGSPGAAYLDTLSAWEVSKPGAAPRPSFPASARAKAISACSAASLLAADAALRRAFVAGGIAFPSSLAGMLLLFGALVGLDKTAPAAAASAATFLAPGAALYAAWMPVFFAPALITLPLSPIRPSPADTLKLLALIVAGFVASLGSTAAVAGRLGAAQGASTPKKPPQWKRKKEMESAHLALLPTAPGPGRFLKNVGLLSSTLAVVTRAGPTCAYRQAAMGALTLWSYAFAARWPAEARQKLHPVLACTVATLAGAAAFGVLCPGGGMLAALAAFMPLSAPPALRAAAGWFPAPGSLLVAMLGPSVFCLGLQLFDRRRLVYARAMVLTFSTLISAASSLFGTAFLARVLGLAPALRTPTISRCITSPLAVAIAEMLGADVGLAVVCVVVTGIFGAAIGSRLLDRWRVKDPVTRGVAMGAAAHGLGTAALASPEPDAFPFAAISMALTATFSTALVSVPAVRALLLAVAAGA